MPAVAWEPLWLLRGRSAAQGQVARKRRLPLFGCRSTDAPVKPAPVRRAGRVRGSRREQLRMRAAMPLLADGLTLEGARRRTDTDRGR